jgi:hypothetical protein
MVEAGNRHSAQEDALSGRRRLQHLSEIGATTLPARHHRVALYDLLLDCEAEVGYRVSKRRYDAPRTFGTTSRARSVRVVVHVIRIEQLIGDLEIAVAVELP